MVELMLRICIMPKMHELASRYKLEPSVRNARKTRKLTKSYVQIIIVIWLS